MRSCAREKKLGEREATKKAREREKNCYRDRERRGRRREIGRESVSLG